MTRTFIEELNMKRQIITILCVMGIFLFNGCQQPQRKSGTINEEKHTMTEEEYRNSIPEDKIAIDASFNPTLKLTKKIRETTLEKLIINKFNEVFSYSIKHKKDFANELYPTSSPYDVAPEVELKYVSSKSNLAKIYFLQDYKSFYKYNSEYFDNVVKAENETNQESERNEAQKNWSKYE